MNASSTPTNPCQHGTDGSNHSAAAATAMTTGGATLNRATRARALERLAGQEYDVIVIGGGVTGAGVALDAASRGLRTALVEKLDLAAGTSRWSSKLCHGGLRYLAKGDIAVAWESVLERGHLMTRIAPHLARPIPYIVPLDVHTSAPMGALAEAGIRAADAMRIAARTSGEVLPRPRRIDAHTTLCLAPGMRTDGLRGAILYYDGWLEDDARLVVALARTAAAHGADIITRCTVLSAGEREAQLRDELTGETLTARGLVINATGVWADQLEPALTVRPSRGSHLVFRSQRLGNPRAVITAPVPGHFGRYVFAIPQPDGLTLVGLTDEAAPGVDGTAPSVPEEDEQFLLSVMSASLQQPLTKEDIVGRFAGLRPLIEEAGQSSTADVSRRHLLLDEPGRPLTIAGGKLTTYRAMAQDAVDAACVRLQRDLPCRTTRLPLIGAAPSAVLQRLEAPERYVRRYGTEAPRVLALQQQYPEMATAVSADCPTTGAELLFGALYEGALSVEDLLERRSRVSFDESAIAPGRALAERALEIAASA
ncbi:glycerol-3-phosphate dehydrogenase/oxidase [Gephyromycinifex aptenodytis]|uniref:glycerol-3-phosphate dehydrogenase/oxidase n=1 Tax=Gephyromycinifex aptenodytis TaxID=2716227 RepID=UPI001D0338E3|nr:glycerol-3-phosphate dehydrogenase/oxidase [Gephyromycinifex aptenodytis]